jgi:hypothetical protein
MNKPPALKAGRVRIVVEGSLDDLHAFVDQTFCSHTVLYEGAINDSKQQDGLVYQRLELELPRQP